MDTAAVPHIQMRTGITDEETQRKLVAEEAAREIPELYFLVLEELNLNTREKNELLAFLIQARVAATTKLEIDNQAPRTATVVLQGEPMDERERSLGIAAIIGDTKLQQFLALERNLTSHSEIRAIASVLRANGVPLTDTQRDQLLNTLVQTRDQYMKTPAAEIDSVEDLEQIMTERDEYERHVLELAPSVLSSKQVPLLFEQYRYLSEQRDRDLEMQRKLEKSWKARHPNKKFIPLYPES